MSFFHSIEFAVITCATEKCGVQFAISKSYQERRRNDHKNFRCPNGHTNYYPQESKEEKLARQLKERDAELGEAWGENSFIQSQLDETSRSYGKMRLRIRNGLCPCCNRSFSNLLNHMKTKHKAFGAARVLKDVRAAYGLTQNQLAKELEIFGPYVSYFETESPKLPEHARETLQGWLDEQFTAI